MYSLRFNVAARAVAGLLACGACGACSVACGGGSTGSTGSPVAIEDERGSVGVPPTAAEYCTKLGFTLAGSQCSFPDGTSCEEWAFYRGQCGQPHSYCNQHGGTVSSKTVDMGTWTAVPACDRGKWICSDGKAPVPEGTCLGKTDAGGS